MMIPPHLLTLLRDRVRAGQYVVGRHVLYHGAAEGFTVRDALAALEQGSSSRITPSAAAA